MIGKRLPDGEFLSHQLDAGEYGRIFRDGEWMWVACTPNGLIGDLAAHAVTEHDSGTISVEPSILVSGGKTVLVLGDDETAYNERGLTGAWHGYLKHGVWLSC